MAKKDKIYMPSGSGGLVRYGEEGKHKITFKPKHVVYIVAGVTILEIVLNLVL